MKWLLTIMIVWTGFEWGWCSHIWPCVIALRSEKRVPLESNLAVQYVLSLRKCDMTHSAYWIPFLSNPAMKRTSKLERKRQNPNIKAVLPFAAILVPAARL
jgi:hypothetical protein